MVRGPEAWGWAAEPMVKATPPPGAGGAAPKGDAGDCDAAGLGCPNAKPGPEDDPGGCGSPVLPVAGDAGWLPNANGFEGAVVEVGVPNENGAG